MYITSLSIKIQRISNVHCVISLSKGAAQWTLDDTSPKTCRGETVREHHQPHAHSSPCCPAEDGDAPPALPALEEGHPLRRAQREDLQALAVTLLEVIFSALAGAGPSSSTAADALQRLLFDVFQRDVSEFRCA